MSADAALFLTAGVFFVFGYRILAISIIIGGMAFRLYQSGGLF